MIRRLAVGKLTPRGARLVVPHGRLAELARCAAQWRAHGHELTIVADPAVLNGLALDHGARVTVRRAVS